MNIDVTKPNLSTMSKIISDFVNGFNELELIGPTVTIFGSARTDTEDKYYKQATKISSLLCSLHSQKG